MRVGQPGLPSCLRAVALVALGVLATGCNAFRHTVGRGPTGSSTIEARQWWAIYGLVALHTVDGGVLAAKPTDYRVTTRWTLTDAILNLFTGIVTITSQTVTVEK